MQSNAPSGMPEMPASVFDPGEQNRAEQVRGDRLIVHISNVFAWLFPILMVVICTQVVLRTAGRSGFGPGNLAWMDDFQWWLYGAATLIGVAYAVTTNSHVRVDIFYDNYDEKKKARTDVFGLVWLFLPFVIFCWDVTQGYAFASYLADEGSSSPNGLHNLWILKVAMNLSFIVVGIAVWAAYIRRLRKLMKPTLGKQLLYAFPSTMFIINLAFYYCALGLALVMTPAGTSIRDASRTWIFDEVDIGPWEIKITVLVSLALTFAVIGAASIRDARRAK